MAHKYLALISLVAYLYPLYLESAELVSICDSLSAATVHQPSAAEFDQAVRAAQADSQEIPCVAALLLGRNHPGDAQRSLELIKKFLQKDRQQSEEVQLLALIARERVAKIIKNCARPFFNHLNNKDIEQLRQELAALRKEREELRHEILDLRRKLKALTSIEKNMDERKTH